MIKVYFYNEQSGEVVRSFSTSDPEAVALNTQTGEQAIDIDESIVNPYVLDGELAERPSNPATLNGTVIENVPVGAAVSFGDQSVIVDDGTAELEFPFLGTYFVTVTCFPYLPKTFEVQYAP